MDDAHEYRRICSAEFLPLVPAIDVLSAKYLAFALQETQLIHGLRARVAAATKSRERLKPGVVLNADIPLPPLSEQKRIAGILKEQMSSAECLRRTLAEQLNAISKLPAALLRRAFSGEL